MDRQSVKLVKGRKRHIAVDVLGLVLNCHVSAVNCADVKMELGIKLSQLVDVLFELGGGDLSGLAHAIEAVECDRGIGQRLLFGVVGGC